MHDSIIVRSFIIFIIITISINLCDSPSCWCSRHPLYLLLLVYLYYHLCIHAYVTAQLSFAFLFYTNSSKGERRSLIYARKDT